MAFDPIDLALIRKLGGGKLPFGKETTVEEIFPAQELSLGRFGRCELPDLLPIKLGEEYKVVWDGVEYHCIAKEGFAEYSTNATTWVTVSVIVLGSGLNACWGEEPTDEPFEILFAKNADDAYALGYGMEFNLGDYEYSSPVLSIWGNVEIVHTIDPEYFASDNGPHRVLTTDAAGNAKWEEKAFYSEVGDVEVVPETTVAIDPSENSYIGTDAYLLEAGKAYVVKWNGVEYPCDTIAYAEGDTDLGVILGNYGALTGGASTGEPFVMVFLYPSMAAEMGMGMMVVAMDGSASATFSIRFKGEVVYPLDNKYLNLAWLPTTEKGATLMEETALDLTNATALTLAYSPAETQPLIIFFDGVRHYCEPATNEGTLCYGSGNPFTIMVMSGVYSIVAAVPGAHTVAVYDPSGEGKIYNIMPTAFLPSMAFKSGKAYGSARSAGAVTESDAYALGQYAVAEGWKTQAPGKSAHAEGEKSIASGVGAHAEGNSTASGTYAHAEGTSTDASDNYSHAEGIGAKATAVGSHAEGFYTIAASDYQHVQGKNNVEDATGEYAHIVGNGKGGSDRSNAHTLDWEGNAWFAGGIELTSPSGKRFRFSVDDSGNLTATEVTE